MFAFLFISNIQISIIFWNSIFDVFRIYTIERTCKNKTQFIKWIRYFKYFMIMFSNFSDYVMHKKKIIFKIISNIKFIHIHSSYKNLYIYHDNQVIHGKKYNRIWQLGIRRDKFCKTLTKDRKRKPENVSDKKKPRQNPGILGMTCEIVSSFSFASLFYDRRLCPCT